MQNRVTRGIVVAVLILVIAGTIYLTKIPELAPAASSSSESEGKEYWYCYCRDLMSSLTAGHVIPYPTDPDEPGTSGATPDEVCYNYCAYQDRYIGGVSYYGRSYSFITSTVPIPPR